MGSLHIGLDLQSAVWWAVPENPIGWPAVCACVSRREPSNAMVDSFCVGSARGELVQAACPKKGILWHVTLVSGGGRTSLCSCKRR